MRYIAATFHGAEDVEFAAILKGVGSYIVKFEKEIANS